jgi:hypothetical protein
MSALVGANRKSSFFCLVNPRDDANARELQQLLRKFIPHEVEIERERERESFVLSKCLFLSFKRLSS